MLKKLLKVGLITGVLLSGFLIAPALAEPQTIEVVAKSAQVSADTAFILISSALVLVMTPALAFFYGGFVSKRNVLNTLMMSFISMGIVGVTWILWGYSLAFSPGNPFIGGLQWFGLNGIGTNITDYLKGSMPEGVLSYAPTIPDQAFMIFQAMFAIITPALISGAIVERMNFAAYSLFILLWSTFVYTPMAHMVWGKGGAFGLLGGLGALDFAGGTVVHIASGFSALVAVFVIGRRKTYPDRLSAPHNVPFILLGAGLLWFGWFGFNAGSALASGGLATTAFVTTNTSAAAALLMWLILENFLRGKPTAVGAASGAVAGLVGITPAAGFVTPLAAILIGAITATCCFFAISVKVKLGIDDSLDTYSVHGVGGTVGALLTAVFATTAVNPGGKDGLLGAVFGGKVNSLQEFGVEVLVIVLTYLFVGIGTFIILKAIDATIGLRVKPEVEFQGLDINEHGEEAYGEEYAAGLSGMMRE